MKTTIKNIILGGLFGLLTTGVMANETGSIYNTNEQEILNYEVKDLTCFNSNDGSVEINIIDSNFYWFSWDNGMNGQEIHNLTPGDYRVKIESTNGEVIYATFTIEGPQYLQGYITQDNFDEFTNLDLMVEGGTSPYTYSWGNGESTEDLIGVSEEGIYNVTITDDNGCFLNLSTYVVNQELSVSETTFTESNTKVVYDMNGNEVNLDYAPYGMYLILNNGKITKIIK